MWHAFVKHSFARLFMLGTQGQLNTVPVIDCLQVSDRVK